MSKKLIVFIDSGDTLVNEGTEYRNEGSPIVQSCELIDGAKEMLLTLKERGYTIELVADGYTQSFDNSYGQHGLKNIFDARTISEEVGEKKPSQAMFETAMKLLHLTDEEANRKFGYPADKTLQLAQNLYEKHKLLTYPRTDSRYLSSDMPPKIAATLQRLPEPYAQLVFRKDSSPKGITTTAKSATITPSCPRKRWPT